MAVGDGGRRRGRLRRAESGSPGRALEAGKRGSPGRAVQAGIRGKRLRPPTQSLNYFYKIQYW